ncbi:MAG: RNB domain-containing ribonuclease [Burkholderiaceae bacterium]
MNVFYEEDGGFKAGNVLSDQGASMQVESATGKRSKVKSGHVLFDFRDPDAATLMRDAQSLADSIDLEFLWECAPQAEFSFKELATDYFGRAATPVESAALVTRLHSAPMYFYRKGRGNYRPAPAEALKAALAGIERKQREAALQATWRDELIEGHLPDAVRMVIRELLFRPDRNRIEYKALIEAASARMQTPERLLLAVGGFASPAALHRDRFVFEQFPRGTGFADVDIPAIGDLPLADVQAFSIDDAATTEIDDALSVRAIDPPSDAAGGAKAWRIGIHIAAPGLAIRRGDAIDAIAHDRYSTVYSPGEKITMLPDAVVEAFTLAAGRACPALSLYVDAVDEGDAGWRIVASTSRIERVPITENLRHNLLDEVVTEANLASGDGAYPRMTELAVLWHFAKALHAKRQEARVASGLRPESHQRADYDFRVDAVDGEDRVSITERRRGAPLDTVVAELMILANSTWGKLLTDQGVAGIYRAQNATFGPAGRVRMITHPAPHAGLGVAQYAWSTSPLRRYVDLVNQWQIASCLDGGGARAFAQNDADLFGIVSGFDATYAAYAEYQSKMERYWCLRWLVQEGRTVVEARATGREDNAMLLEIPLLVRVPGMAVVGPTGTPSGTTGVTRGQRIEVEIISTDPVDLSVQCRLVAIIEEVDELEDDEAEDDRAIAVAGSAEAGIAAVDVETASAEASAVHDAPPVAGPDPAST